MFIESSQLKQALLEAGLASASDLDIAFQTAKDKSQEIGEILIGGGKINEDDYRRVLAHVLGVPFIDLKSQKLEFEILSLIPEPIARNHNIVAYARKGELLEVAMLDTDDLSAIDFVKKKTGLKILPRLTNTESMKSALIQYQKTLKADFGDIIQQEASNLEGKTRAGR